MQPAAIAWDGCHDALSSQVCPKLGCLWRCVDRLRDFSLFSPLPRPTISRQINQASQGKKESNQIGWQACLVEHTHKTIKTGTWPNGNKRKLSTKPTRKSARPQRTSKFTQTFRASSTTKSACDLTFFRFEQGSGQTWRDARGLLGFRGKTRYSFGRIVQRGLETGSGRCWSFLREFFYVIFLGWANVCGLWLADWLQHNLND